MIQSMYAFIVVWIRCNFIFQHSIFHFINQARAISIRWRWHRSLWGNGETEQFANVIFAYAIIFKIICISRQWQAISIFTNELVSMFEKILIGSRPRSKIKGRKKQSIAGWYTAFWRISLYNVHESMQSKSWLAFCSVRKSALQVWRREKRSTQMLSTIWRIACVHAHEQQNTFWFHV